MSSVDGRRDQPPPGAPQGASPPADGRSKPPPLPPAARPKQSVPPPLPPSAGPTAAPQRSGASGAPVDDTAATRPRLESDESIPVEIDVPIPIDSGADVASIDRLLALTESEWDPDAQALSLKRVAEASPKPAHPPSQRKLAAVAIPTPYELAPTLLPKAQILAAAQAVQQAQAAQQGASPSKGPPPLPVEKRASKGPPPLPPSGSSPAPPPVRSDAPPPVRVSEPVRREALASQNELVDLLNVRVQVLEAAADRVGLGRAHLEMAIASDMLLADDARVLAHAEAAVRADGHLAAAHSILRRKKHGRANLGAMLGHLDREIAAVRDETGAVALLVERARLLDAMGERPERIRQAWEQALARAPQNAAALKGLEVELGAETLREAGDKREGAYDALATHLARMAETYAESPALAAWLHVERAQILELRLGRLDAARGALERALALDPSIGAVRDACFRHVAGHDDAASMAALLAEEAELESSSERGARLDLYAASILSERLDDPARALGLLERATRRPHADVVVHRMVLDAIVRLREREGNFAAAREARRARLAYLEEPMLRAHEHRTLARISERLDDREGAIQETEAALAIEPNDTTLLESLDRLLAASGLHEQRVAFWSSEAARHEDPAKRARALRRAAQITDAVLDRSHEAIRLLRSAWVAAPGDWEALDALSRLLAAPPTETVDHDTRARIDLFVQAAEGTADVGRKLAYLEKVAFLWEEVVGDAARAAATYEEVLTLDPQRRTAILGLARAAARAGDDRALARALLEEARLAGDGVDSLTLRVRAASALARVDPERALSLVQQVIEQDAAHAAAGALETRLLEDAGQWARAAQSLLRRIDTIGRTKDALPLWLDLARILEVHLRDVKGALEALREARAVDPSHPVPPEEIARLLESAEDFRGLRDAYEGLAGNAKRPDEKFRYLIRAAEIDELRLRDDERAAKIYAQAYELADVGELAGERLSTVLSRRAVRARAKQASAEAASIVAELASLVERRAQRAPEPRRPHLAFDLAQLYLEIGRDTGQVMRLCEVVLMSHPEHAAAHRLVEQATRRAGDWTALGHAVQAQAEVLADPTARLGLLWELAALEEWRLPAGNADATYAAILTIDPSDPGALEARLRRELPAARRGEREAVQHVVTALRSLAALAGEDSSRLATELRLAILVEGSANGASDGPGAREALAHYREALRLDPLSVTAATGLARTANRLNDTEGAVAAASALAELASEPGARSRYLLEAAELLLSTEADERLGTYFERRQRASSLLERALDADADAIGAATVLCAVRTEDGAGERLVDPLRSALRRAKNVEAIIFYGSEIARIARDDLADLPLGIDAMRRVRAVAPDHAPSLLTLSELCIAQRAWPEAVDALESVVDKAREVPPRLTALFALASIYEHVLERPGDAETALRSALELDPASARALRALIRHVSTHHAPTLESLSKDDLTEITQLLAKLAEVEDEAEARCDILLQLADIRLRLGNAAGAEQALIEAVARTPGSDKALARLGALHKMGADPLKAEPKAQIAYARALGQVVARGRELGVSHAPWYATLGTLETEALGRLRDGIAHLQRAVQLDPTRSEIRHYLARAFAKSNAHEEAIRTLMGMIAPSSAPLLSLRDMRPALADLEASFTAERRGEEALVVSELRALGGDLDDGRFEWLKNRRLRARDASTGELDRPTLVSHVLPIEGRHVLLEVAAAVAGLETKVLRADVAELGLSSRDRVSSRSGHPTRALLDRLLASLGLADIELVITPSVARTRVLAQDTLWIVVPKSLAETPEPLQLAALGRALTRISLGAPWLEELPPPHVEAYLVACARQVVPTYGVEDLDVLASKLVAHYEPLVAKSIGRKQKKLLEELAVHLQTREGRLVPMEPFIHALARAEVRSAMLLTGDLLATLEDLRSLDPNLARATETPGPRCVSAFLDHPFGGDVCRFALTGEAVALRRRIGTTWTS